MKAAVFIGPGKSIAVGPGIIATRCQGAEQVAGEFVSRALGTLLASSP